MPSSWIAFLNDVQTYWLQTKVHQNAIGLHICILHPNARNNGLIEQSPVSDGQYNLLNYANWYSFIIYFYIKRFIGKAR